jgi:hypothetical protein
MTDFVGGSEMGWFLGVVVATLIVLAAAAAFVWRPVRTAWREARFAEACRAFHWQREGLEARFVRLGVARAKPEAARWIDCQFDDDVAYARNRSTGELSAFVAVTIRVEAFEGSPDAARARLDATAVFRFNGKRWETDGRAIFDVTPTEAIHLFQRDLEMVGQEVAGR